jgi:acyl-CoA hydrolase
MDVLRSDWKLVMVRRRLEMVESSESTFHIRCLRALIRASRGCHVDQDLSSSPRLVLRIDLFITSSKTNVLLLCSDH